MWSQKLEDAVFRELETIGTCAWTLELEDDGKTWLLGWRVEFLGRGMLLLLGFGLGFWLRLV